MPRPLRIEFENACYHVMNRGRGRQTIFHDERYYQAFLQGLSEAHQRFGLIIHAYCLMGNHYHLLVTTPHGNLSRCMRHISGLYTQRYNQFKKTDGPLFRGRFKAILVEVDNYFLPLTRYIHRNPVETRPPLVKRLVDYRWSSYPAYLNQSDVSWLDRELAYALSGKKQRYRGYQAYVENKQDESELNEFYSKQHLKPILGSDAYIERVIQDTADREEKTRLSRAQNHLPTLETIVDKVAQEFDISRNRLCQSRRGPGSKNIARWAAVYLCRELSGCNLKEVSLYFNFRHIISAFDVFHPP